MNIRLEKTDYNWLETYCSNACNTLNLNNAMFWERYALTAIKQYDTLSDIWKITDDAIEVGFAVNPSYIPHILNTIFIYPRYRRQGIAEFVINVLQTRNLSCIAINVDALRLYKRMGFVITDPNPENQDSFSLERKL